MKALVTSPSLSVTRVILRTGQSCLAPESHLTDSQSTLGTLPRACSSSYPAPLEPRQRLF